MSVAHDVAVADAHDETESVAEAQREGLPLSLTNADARDECDNAGDGDSAPVADGEDEALGLFVELIDTVTVGLALQDDARLIEGVGVGDPQAVTVPLPVTLEHAETLKEAVGECDKLTDGDTDCVLESVGVALGSPLTDTVAHSDAVLENDTQLEAVCDIDGETHAVAVALLHVDALPEAQLDTLTDSDCDGDCDVDSVEEDVPQALVV